MFKLRINPIVAKDLKNIRDYIAEDSEEYAAKTIKEIYGKFENLQMFPGIGADLSKRVSFRTEYKYAIWEDYVIIYKVGNEYVEIYRVINRYQDITRILNKNIKHNKYIKYGKMRILFWNTRINVFNKGHNTPYLRVTAEYGDFLCDRKFMLAGFFLME